MTSRTQGPLKALTRGIVAGAVGTLAMDLVWYSRYRRSGGEDGFLDWEFSSSTEGFEDAGAPAQVGRRVAKAVFHRELPDHSAGLTNNVVHWATGCQWGALYSIARRNTETGPGLGLALGPVAWGAAYGLLGAAGIYEPIWRYDSETLVKDLTAHLVFGIATATAHRALDRPEPA